MPIVTAQAYACVRCLHVWLPRISSIPKECPACKSPYWRRPRRPRPALEALPLEGESQRREANDGHMPIVKVEAFQCNRCKHTWLPRSFPKMEPPRTCPSCKSPYWDVARTRTLTDKAAKPRRRRTVPS